MHEPNTKIVATMKIIGEVETPWVRRERHPFICPKANNATPPITTAHPKALGRK